MLALKTVIKRQSSENRQLYRVKFSTHSLARRMGESHYYRRQVHRLDSLRQDLLQPAHNLSLKKSQSKGKVKKYRFLDKKVAINLFLLQLLYNLVA